MKKYFIRLLAMACISLLGWSTNCYANDVKIGKAHITVNLSGDMPVVTNRVVHIASNRILGKVHEINESKPVVNSDRTKFEFDVPLETEKGYVLVKVTDDSESARAYGFVDVCDGDSLTLDCIYDHKDFVSVIPSSRQGMNRYSMVPTIANPGLYFLQQIKNNVTIEKFGDSFQTPLKPDAIYISGYKAWEITLRQLNVFFYPIVNDRVHKLILKEEDVSCFEKNLVNFIYAEYFLDYNKTREKWAPDGNRELPPLEYYSFLNEIDYDSLLDFYPFVTPNQLTTKIIKNVPVGIEPIGDTPVAEWKAQTKEKLSKVMTNVPDILLDLLSASSYYLQLDEAHTPLTDKQKKNIAEGYSNDLGKVILDADRRYISGQLYNTDLW